MGLKKIIYSNDIMCILEFLQDIGLCKDISKVVIDYNITSEQQIMRQRKKVFKEMVEFHNVRCITQEDPSKFSYDFPVNKICKAIEKQDKIRYDCFRRIIRCFNEDNDNFYYRYLLTDVKYQIKNLRWAILTIQLYVTDDQANYLYVKHTRQDLLRLGKESLKFYIKLRKSVEKDKEFIRIRKQFC